MQQYTHPDGGTLNANHIKFLRQAAAKMGRSITWQSLAARPGDRQTKALIAACDRGETATAAVEALPTKGWTTIPGGAVLKH